MLAMINQEIDLGTRRQILQKFKKLISKVEKETDFSELLKEMLQGPLSLERAIYWYTHPVGVFKIINNLLRSC